MVQGRAAPGSAGCGRATPGRRRTRALRIGHRDPSEIVALSDVDAGRRVVPDGWNRARCRRPEDRRGSALCRSTSAREGAAVRQAGCSRVDGSSTKEARSTRFGVAEGSAQNPASASGVDAVDHDVHIGLARTIVSLENILDALEGWTATWVLSGAATQVSTTCGCSATPSRRRVGAALRRAPYLAQSRRARRHGAGIHAPLPQRRSGPARTPADPTSGPPPDRRLRPRPAIDQRASSR